MHDHGSEIVVPGSISNLGPSFDAMSVAVQLYLRLRIVARRDDVPDTIEWEFVGDGPSGENRIESAYRLARARIGVPAPGLRVQVHSEIPQTAGLGSSAAAAVAGLRLYEAATGMQPGGAPNGSPTARDAVSVDERWLALATELEGHPDNAAAALLGGLTVSCEYEDGRIVARSSPWPDDVRLVVATPDLGLHTSEARRVLPQDVPLRDAIFNLQRALLFVRALESGRYEDLREAMRDRWHQPARAALIPGLSEAMAWDDPSVLGVCLSGAGPSILVLATEAGTPRASALLAGLYTRLGMPCTIRALSAHNSNRTS